MYKIYATIFAAMATLSSSAAVLTFEQISKDSPEFVVKEGDAYVIKESFAVNQGDVLKLENNDIIKFEDAVQVEIFGYADFAPSEKAYITRANDEAKPIGFIFRPESTGAKIHNVTSEYVGYKFINRAGALDAYNSTFSKCNGKLDRYGAIMFSTKQTGNKIDNCKFVDNLNAGIATAANLPAGMEITNCYFHNNSAPLNVVVGINDILIENNVFEGNTKEGGVSLTNVYNNKPYSTVTVKNNEIRNHRFGIFMQGNLKAVIVNNKIVGNKYQSNPMDGGAGISSYFNNESVYVEGNLIEDNLWGATLIGTSKNINFGKVEDKNAADYNPGNNVFLNNGNGGVQYDLYNNSSEDMYAQGNTWSVETQDEASIETVVFHKNDDAKLGQVFFMPAADPAGVNDVVTDNEAPAEYFNLQGLRVDNPGQGVYIRRQGSKTTKVICR